jgi:Zn-dependent protease with chaperone function
MVRATYLDGRSTRVQAVSLSLDGSDLVIAGEGIAIRLPFAQVKVDERLGRAPRRLRLDNGAICEVRDLDGLDRLLRAAAHRDGWVDRMQRHRALVLFSAIAFVAMTVAAYRWVLPWTAAAIAQRLPPKVGKLLGAQTLELLDKGVLQPSTLPESRQQDLAAAFRGLHLPEGGVPSAALLFRSSQKLPANAFTLTDGTIIMLDDLVTSLDDPEILAVLGHELGHVRGKHSLQLLLQGSVVAAFLTFYVGDISTLLAAAPAAVLQAKYSQGLEQQADDYGAALLLHNGMSPALLADALEKLTKAHPDLGGFLASHPPTEERMLHLRRLGSRGQ